MLRLLLLLTALGASALALTLVSRSTPSQSDGLGERSSSVARAEDRIPTSDVSGASEERVEVTLPIAEPSAVDTPAELDARIETAPPPVGRFAVIGTVVDEEDRPVPGAHVDVTLRGDSGRRWPVESIRVNAAGRFRVELDGESAARSLVGKTLVLTCWSPGFHTVEDEIGIQASGDRVLETKLELEALAVHHVTGVVVDSGGTPVLGAVVQVVAWGNAAADVSMDSFETGADGRFSMELSEGTDATVKAFCDGIGSARVTGTGDLGAIVLSPGLVLAGAVKSRSGRPVPGLEVWLERVGADVGERAVVTGPDGRFRFTALEEGTWRVTPEGWEDCGVEALAGSEGVAIVVPALTGRLVAVDPAGRRLDPGDISLFSIDPESGQRLTRPHTINVFGTPTLEGELNLRIDEPGHYAASYRVKRDGTVWAGFLPFHAKSQHLELTLRVEAEPTRPVVFSARSAAGERILQWSASVRRRNDRSLVARIRSADPTADLAAGEHEVEILPNGSTLTPEWREFIVVDESTTRVELRASDDGGRVEFDLRMSTAAYEKVSPKAARQAWAQLRVRYRKKGNRRWLAAILPLPSSGRLPEPLVLSAGTYEYKVDGWGQRSPSWKRKTGSIEVRTGTVTRLEILVEPQ